MENCTTCGNELQGRQRKYCSKKCHNINGNLRYQLYGNQQRRGIEKKIKAVLDKGGKCSKCNYDKNLSSLSFHHLHDKDFNLDIRRFSNTKDSILEAELQKCILLCMNCHNEEHNPEYFNWKMVGADGFEPSTKKL